MSRIEEARQLVEEFGLSVDPKTLLNEANARDKSLRLVANNHRFKRFESDVKYKRYKRFYGL